MIPKKVPLVSMDLYLRRKYGVISGVIHDMRAGRWACITGLVARIPSKDVRKLELQITGIKHKTLQGQIYLAEEEAGELRPFASGLELLKRIHQLV